MNSLIFFPFLLQYRDFAPFIIRVILGLTLLYFGFKKTEGLGQSSGSNSKIFGYLEIVVAIFIVVGLFTQLAVLMNAIILLIKIIDKIREKKFLNEGVNYYLLLFVMALSLIFSGSGILALDRLFG